ncbi:MAG: fatty acid desaturase [Planctomycetota bacterium]
MNNETGRQKPAWYYGTARFAKPSLWRAVYQLLNTFIPYFLLLGIIIYLVETGFSYWLTLPLSIVAAFLLVRIFIFFHDCCHNSFFTSRRANMILGYICGFLTCTPYRDWQWTHSRHHATAADLDKRGYGSVWTMTVDEYQSASLCTRIRYRLYRNPLVMLVPGPVIACQPVRHERNRKTAAGQCVDHQSCNCSNVRHGSLGAGILGHLPHRDTDCVCLVGDRGVAVLCSAPV